MNHSFARLLLPVLAAGLCAACVAMPRTAVSPPPGLIYEDIKAPLTVNFHGTPADSPKTGTAMTRYFCVPFYPLLSAGWEDACLKKAADNGGIKQVDYADYEFFNVLGVYEEFRVTAHGR